MKYDKLIYYRSDYSREAQKIEMEIPPNLTIAEFKIVCRRLAAATGYAHESITKEFGKDKEVGNQNQLKLLFD